MTTVTIEELTEASLDGNGVFDVMMRTVGLHLEREFSAGRIRGTDYANVYLQALSDTLARASEYALAKAKLPLELQMLEAQVLKVATDTAVATKQGALIEAQTTAEYANIELTKKEVELKDFDLHFLKPKELEILSADLDLKKAQLPLLMKDLELKQQQIEISKKELDLKAQQLELGKAEIALKTQQLELGKAEIVLKQQQVELGKSELLLKAQQVEVAKAEVAIKAKQLELSEYELKNKLPAEVRSINSQTDLYNQKTVTEKAQTDPSVIKDGSVIALQNNLLAEQAKTYLRDALYKFMKVFTDTWAVRNNADPDGNGANEQNLLFDKSLGEVIDHVGLDLGVNLKD